MKFLTEVADISELNRLRLLFEMNGVLIYTGNEDTARNYSFLHPAGKYAIYVVYEEQHKDATMLMENEEHIVENQVDLEAYKEHIKENNSATISHILRKTAITGIIVLLLVAGLIWLVLARNT